MDWLGVPEERFENHSLCRLWGVKQSRALQVSASEEWVCSSPRHSPMRSPEGQVPCKEFTQGLLHLWGLHSSQRTRMDTGELGDGVKGRPTAALSLPVSYKVLNAESFFLKEAGQELMRNSSRPTHTQAFVLLRTSRPPAVNASYGPLSAESPVPPELMWGPSGGPALSWRVRSFILARRVLSTAPTVRVLFYVVGRRDREGDTEGGPGRQDQEKEAEQLCLTVLGVSEAQETWGACLLRADAGSCLAELEPAAAWFRPPGRASSREPQEQREARSMELHYQARPVGAGGGCVPEAGETPAAPLKRIGSVRLLRVPPGATPLSRLRLGGGVVVQTSSKPVRKSDRAAFIVSVSSASPLTRFTLRKIQHRPLVGRNPPSPLGTEYPYLHAARHDTTHRISGATPNDTRRRWWYFGGAKVLMSSGLMRDTWGVGLPGSELLKERRDIPVDPTRIRLKASVQELMVPATVPIPSGGPKTSTVNFHGFVGFAQASRKLRCTPTRSDTRIRTGESYRRLGTNLDKCLDQALQSLTDKAMLAWFRGFGERAGPVVHGALTRHAPAIRSLPALHLDSLPAARVSELSSNFSSPAVTERSPSQDVADGTPAVTVMRLTALSSLLARCAGGNHAHPPGPGLQSELATVQKGLSLSTVRPRNSHLWNTALEPGTGSQLGTISIVFQRKTPTQRSYWGRVSPIRTAQERINTRFFCPSTQITKGQIQSDGGLVELLQLDFEVEELSSQPETQVITWSLELPGAQRRGENQGTMRISTVTTDYVGLAPLVTDTELLNTAVLTGKKVSAALRTVAVEADGSLTDVSNFTRCQSTDEDVLKVSDRCDYIFVNGKETKGRMRVAVNFTYGHLSAQLDMTVWMPRLPLQVEVSDPELSQIKGWRVPVPAGKRSSWESEEDEDRKGKGCTLQYQHALVRVFAHFLAEQPDPRLPPARFLGAGWLLDVTRLVRHSLRVEDARIARLHAGRVLSGRSVGVTAVKVLSPLSDSVLGERMVKVLDDRVSITELGVQLVSGLSLSLQLSPGSNRAIVATATTQEVLHRPKQEAVIGCWLQFSDGSLMPLDVYDSSSYTLAVTSLDKGVASVRGSPPTVTAVGEGQGALVRVEMGISEACQKSKRKSLLAVAHGDLRVVFRPSGLLNEPPIEPRTQRPERGGRAFISSSVGGASSSVGETSSSVGGVGNSWGGVRNGWGGASGGTGGARNSLDEASSSVGAVSSPVYDQGMGEAGANTLDMGEVGANTLDYSSVPSQVEVPRWTPAAEVDSGVLHASRFPSSLEIGMYALLGVLCLAILVFLLNCVSYLTGVRRKKPPAHCQEPGGHRHNWVWLGTEADLAITGPAAPPPPEGHAAIAINIDVSPGMGMVGMGKSATLGRRTSAPPAMDPLLVRRGSLQARPSRGDSLHSPTSKRKRVQFTTFSSLDGPHYSTLPGMHWASKVQDFAERNGPFPEALYANLSYEPKPAQGLRSTCSSDCAAQLQGCAGNGNRTLRRWDGSYRFSWEIQIGGGRREADAKFAVHRSGPECIPSYGDGLASSGSEEAEPSHMSLTSKDMHEGNEVSLFSTSRRANGRFAKAASRCEPGPGGSGSDSRPSGWSLASVMQQMQPSWASLIHGGFCDRALFKRREDLNVAERGPHIEPASSSTRRSSTDSINLLLGGLVPALPPPPPEADSQMPPPIGLTTRAGLVETRLNTGGRKFTYISPHYNLNTECKGREMETPHAHHHPQTIATHPGDRFCEMLITGLSVPCHWFLTHVGSDSEVKQRALGRAGRGRAGRGGAGEAGTLPPVIMEMRGLEFVKGRGMPRGESACHSDYSQIRVDMALSRQSPDVRALSGGYMKHVEMPHPAYCVRSEAAFEMLTKVVALGGEDLNPCRGSVPDGLSRCPGLGFLDMRCSFRCGRSHEKEPCYWDGRTRPPLLLSPLPTPSPTLHDPQVHWGVS
ncbi:hypothetical protein AAFF_G00252100 [Aldrovandia affinis]|uniref:Transmembrane protein n=1 Tax=Aldrovandia affinis TaxID=143900 RepID=A0AAD7STN5_9TELE|nr:hypothetical protein AAFF_G00252100 [Aldrovandia affinis]